MTLFDVLQKHAATQADAKSFVFLGAQGDTQAVTFSQLSVRARAVAAELQGRCPPGDRVFLMYQPGLDFVAAILGCFAAGVVAVPMQLLQNRRALPRLRGIVADAGGRFALTNTASMQTLLRMLPNIAELIPQLEWLCVDTIADAEAANFHPRSSQPEALAFLQYTSGSTGMPKGVMVSHGNLLNNLRSLRRGLESDRSDIFAGWLPMYHDMGLIGNVFHPLYAGATAMLFAPMTFLLAPITWLRAISEWHATISGAPNFAYELCATRIKPEEMTGIDLSSWRIAFNGAEPVKAKVIDAFLRKFRPYGFSDTAFLPCYGMAETTLFVSAGLPQARVAQLRVDTERLAHNAITPREESNTVLVGCGNTHLEHVRIVDPESLHVLPDDCIGELWISGPSVAMGYWNKPELTAAVFNAYTAAGAGPYLRTGDLGFWHLGELFVTGRSKDLLIIRGRNYYPQDIESAVEQSHDALVLGGAAAFALEDGSHSESQTGLVVVAEVRRSALSRLDLQLHRQIIAVICEEVLSTHGLRIADVVLIKQATLPKTSSGKVRRSQCRELYRSQGFQSVDIEMRRAAQSTRDESQAVRVPASPPFLADGGCLQPALLNSERQAAEDSAQ